MRLRTRHSVVTAAVVGAISLTVILLTASPASADSVDSAPIRTITGGNAVGMARGIATANDGTIYVDNYAAAAAISVFGPTADGNATAARTISGVDTNLLAPFGLALDGDGNLWVADQGAGVLEFAAGADGDAPPIRVISGLNTGVPQPTGIAIGADGSIYVSSLNGQSVSIFAPAAAGNVAPARTISGPATGLDGPMGIALSKSGLITVGNAASSSVSTFAADATGNVAPLRTISGNATDLNSPYGVAVDAAGNISVANENGPTVTTYPAGATGDQAPSHELVGANTGLNAPTSIAVDSAGRLYVPNLGDNTVHVYGAALSLTRVAPSSGSTAGGSPVALTGSGFAAGASVTFGGVAATDVAVVNSTTITAVTPPHATGAVDVAVTQDGVTSTLVGAFTYAPSLATTGVDPSGMTGAAIALLLGGIGLIIAGRLGRKGRTLA